MKAETERKCFLGKKSMQNIIILYCCIVLFYCYYYIMVICQTCVDIGFKTSSHGLSASAFLWIVSLCPIRVPCSPMFFSLVQPQL